MCGIGGFVGRSSSSPEVNERALRAIAKLIRHRGPDGEGIWVEPKGLAGLAHTRLSVIDLSTGDQPMHVEGGLTITYNGEVYNFEEIRRELGEESFRTKSDTETILRAYQRWGADCVQKLRGMFAFAIWDAAKQRLFFARDRFGIKPFYYMFNKGRFYFASEMKALLPFVDAVETDPDALEDYFAFQFCLGDKTLFKNVRQLLPAHRGSVGPDGDLKIERYWEVHYNTDWDHTEKYFVEKVRETLFDSVHAHLRSDVEVGAYVSGGVDSSLVASIAREHLSAQPRFLGFNGRFVEPGFDESQYAQSLGTEKGLSIKVVDISEDDFIENIGKVVYHLDQPIAGPGSFPQYMVARTVRQHLKVVLGGQGGDEIFGGYTRYLIAYFEQCLRGAIDGTLDNGKFIVTYESILPNLKSLKNYKPLLQEFFADGIFDRRDKRYYRLINRRNTLSAINQDRFSEYNAFEHFQKIYWGNNVDKGSYFDFMTHFDFKTLLPALLHVEDRMSMAHGIESRVPFLDHHLVELAATIPSNIKFQSGELKRLLRTAFTDKIPRTILDRTDKMGFPVPLKNWSKKGSRLRSFLTDTFLSKKAKSRFYLAPNFDFEKLIESESAYGRNLWALLSLEIWQQQFHDTHATGQFKG